MAARHSLDSPSAIASFHIGGVFKRVRIWDMHFHLAPSLAGKMDNAPLAGDQDNVVLTSHAGAF